MKKVFKGLPYSDSSSSSLNVTWVWDNHAEKQFAFAWHIQNKALNLKIPLEVLQ